MQIRIAVITAAALALAACTERAAYTESTGTGITWSEPAPSGAAPPANQASTPDTGQNPAPPSQAVGQGIVWSNGAAQSGIGGSWPPPPAPPQARPPAGAPECREFQRTIIIDGKQQAAYGTACRQPDGTWRIKP